MRREVLFCNCHHLDENLEARLTSKTPPISWQIVGVDFPSERVAVLFTYES